MVDESLLVYVLLVLGEMSVERENTAEIQDIKLGKFADRMFVCIRLIQFHSDRCTPKKPRPVKSTCTGFILCCPGKKNIFYEYVIRSDSN